MKKNKLKKKPNWEKIIYWFVLGSMALASVGVILIMIFAPSSPKIAEPFERVKSEYVLMLLQCLLGIFAMFLPSILKNKLRLVIPSKMIIVYAVFLYCAIFLGEVRKFYYTVPHWDTILHTSSGAMLGALGFSFINLLNKTDRVPAHIIEQISDRCLTTGHKNTVRRNLFVDVKLNRRARPQLTHIKVILYKRYHSGE